MPNPPARCRRCGLLYPARQYGGEGSINIRFVGCTEECPRCGGTAEVLDGTYDFVGDTVRLIAGPAATIETFRTIAAVLEGYKSGRKSAIETKQEIEQVAPTVGEWLGKVGSDPTFLGASLQALAAIMAALIGLYAVLAAGGTSNEELRKAVEDALLGATGAQSQQRDLGATVPRPKLNRHLRRRRIRLALMTDRGKLGC
jgi:hypothetical protein